MINMFEPTITSAHIEAVKSALDERFIDGESTFKFKNILQLKFGRKYCSLCNSGTSALIIALRAATELGIINKSELVYTTPLSFISTASAIVMAGHTPVFHDVDKNGLVDFKYANKRTQLGLPVALYGKKYPYKWNFPIIEDDAQAHGAHNKDVLANCFSFYTTKNLTVCGNGGAILTDNDLLYNIMESMINNGRTNKNYEHKYISSSYRINNINAALGLVNLKLLEKNTQKRRFFAKSYDTCLKDVEQVKLPPLEDHVFHLYVIRVPPMFRDMLRTFLKKNKIQTSIQYPILIPHQLAFKEYNNLRFPNAEQMVKEIISLPMHPNLILDDIIKVSNKIREFFGFDDV